MERFCKEKRDLIGRMREQGLVLPYADNSGVYHTPLSLYGKTVENRIGIQPLEGFDSDRNGAPTDMVRRRYLRFVNSGAGLIWFEACAVSDDGKSNPFQMALTEENVGEFKALLRLMDRTAEEAGRQPIFKVLQLTHSGRMSRDAEWNRMPLAAKGNTAEDIILADDARIGKMVEEHIRAARLAAEAGFDAVDIKVCHGYFLSELLSAFHRSGVYGGSFENRTRALFEIVDGIRALPGEKIGIAVRLNAFDSVPYPYGYGMTKEGDRLKPDMGECIQICKMLRDRGVRLVNISASTPAQHLFGTDPTDKAFGKYVSSADLLTAAKVIKEAVPDMVIVGTGLSEFGSLGAEIGAGGIEDGWFDIAGFGRQALAYPDFAKDILEGHGLDEEKCCVGCGSCFRLMDPGHTMTGCIVRDREIYFPLYQKYVLKK